MNHISEGHEKRIMQRIDANVVEEPKTRCRYLVSKREMMVGCTPKSSKMPLNKSFYRSLGDWSLETKRPSTPTNGNHTMVSSLMATSTNESITQSSIQIEEVRT